MIRGSCLCGGIKFEIDGAVMMSRYCHCKNCRKFSGTAQAAWGLVNAADFKQTVSDSALKKFDAGSGSLRTFCSSCGSSLWFEPQNMPDFLGIALGAIDEGEVSAPEAHLWVGSSPDWESIEGDLPQYDTIQQKPGFRN